MAFEKCPQCGYQDAIVVSKFSSVMNVYVSKEGKKAAYNTDQEKFTTTNGIEWTREDIFNAKKTATPSPTPSTPTPTIPKK